MTEKQVNQVQARGQACSWGPAEKEACATLVQLALAEDLGTAGDLTSQLLIPPELPGATRVVTRAPGVIAGLPAAAEVFASLNPAPAFVPLVEDGTLAEPGTVLATVAGSMRSILTGERTALNFLQRLSGVATMTWRHVQAVAGLPCAILDTRKTTPGWRRLEKYAVRCGGGRNHRSGLFDAVLVKDNHLAALAGRPNAIEHVVQMARAHAPAGVQIEVEVDSLDQLELALRAGPDVVLLDNMRPEQLRQAVRRRNELAPQVRLEASGGVSLSTVRGMAETGIDFISVGALTHSAPALDIALDYG